ncbi:NAD(P)-binding Rossmann-fold superfamily protein [Raphanus sativus]|uniref:NADPH-dependent aldehyde reductase 2, chloroplastic n=1 Tax=Raphanus sativus TaxID=3726 RepID=A0A6J0P932_RAPSA|nr:NADPH-dependent aldehyde reductase 2, chloroplastic [Raphanus sativus]KAJ4892837.1 NAD(P)-binding Rossmann-fold superfamily protein [Raphanus sativus]
MAASSSVSSPALCLAGRVAIVTGSSRGIGRGIAIHLAELGARIVINYSTNSAEADKVAAAITTNCPDNDAAEQVTGKHPRVIVVKADISEPNQVKSLFDEAERAFGSPVHILVNSAAIADPNHSSISNTSEELFDRIFSVNTRGAFLCAREAANRLKRGGGGRIILLSSSLVQSLKPSYGSYTASKAAIEAMSKILAKELKGTQITVNCVSPGPVATEMFFAGLSNEIVEKVKAQNLFGRLGETKDIANVVGFLASDASEWINGQVIIANGGSIL